MQRDFDYWIGDLDVVLQGKWEANSGQPVHLGRVRHMRPLYSKAIHKTMNPGSAKGGLRTQGVVIQVMRRPHKIANMSLG